MSKIKFSKNLFIDSNELNRLMKFIFDDGMIQMFKSIITNYGIVGNNDFLCSVGSGIGNYDFLRIESGLAYDSELNAIKLEAETLKLEKLTDSTRWVIISHQVDNKEIGTVKVEANGSITGIGTKFTEVLRSQPNFPVKVKFPDSSLNTSEYEVIYTYNDTYATVSGELQFERDLKYAVVGAFTPGFIPDESDKFIYDYDSCKIEIVISEEQPELLENQFLIAKLSNSSNGFFSIEDLRSEFFTDINRSQRPVIANNKIASLLDVKVINNSDSDDALLDILIESGYTISSYSVSYSANSGFFNILGSCNLLGSGDIPNDYFKNWIIFNKSNMKYVKITSNVNKQIAFTGDVLSFIGSGGGSLVIVPDYQEMEYEVSFSGEDTRTPMVFKFSMQNIKNRFLIPVEKGDETTITIKQRMINGIDFQTAFRNLAPANFNDYQSQTVLLSNSQFVVNL